MKNNDQTFLGQEKLGRLMGKYSVPCVISLLVAALYNIVDQIFIANAAYLGSDGNAANTVVFPLRRRLLRVCEHIPRRGQARGRAPKRRQRGSALGFGRYSAVHTVPGFFE